MPAPGASLLTSTLAYLAFALLAVVGPGLAAQRLLRLRIDPALVIPAGLALCAVAYLAALRSAQPWLFPVTVLSLDATLPFARRPWQLAPGPSLRGALPACLGLLAIFAFTLYPFNRVGSKGDFLLDPCERVDTAFHIGVTWELVEGSAPQVPGLSGYPLSYHVAGHLIRAAAARWAGIHPYDAMSRFDITLWGLALILALRAVAATLGFGRVALAIIGWAPLACDFSFLLALYPGSHFWAAHLRGNLIEDLFFANTLVPALAIALAALVALVRYRAEEGRGWIVLGVGLAAAVPFFKVFLAAQFIGGVTLAWLISRERRGSVLLLALGCALGLVYLIASNSGTTPAIFIHPLDITQEVRAAVGLQHLGGWRLLAWGLVWTLASLGLRVVGIGSAKRALYQGAPHVATLAAMALSGWPIALIVRLTTARRWNEAAYFVEQSGLLLWLFAVPVVVALVAGMRRRWLGALLCFCLVSPAAIEYGVRKATRPPDVIPARALRAMRALAAASRPGDVVLEYPAPTELPAPIVFIGRRVAASHFFPYRAQFASDADVARRGNQVHRFFMLANPDKALALARSLNARFVYLTGKRRLAFDPRGRLELLFEEGDQRVYRVPDAPS